MIKVNTVLKVADNSGVLKVRCIGINGPTGRRTAFLGEVIVVSCIAVDPGSKIKKGDKQYAVIVRTKAANRRKDGSFIKFDENAVVLIAKGTGDTVGTRVSGPVCREIRAHYPKITSLAPEAY